MKPLMPDFPRADIAGQLGNAEQKRGDWTDGRVSIPRKRSPRRAAYNADYLGALVLHYSRLGCVCFTNTTIDPRKTCPTNPIKDYERLDLYRRMLRAGDTVPPLVVEYIGEYLFVQDGNHRRQAALDTKRYRLPALLMERKP